MDSEQSSASFSFPAIPGFRGEEFKRARVHFFWSDSHIRNNYSQDQWPLLFEGEIVSDSFSKTVSSRNIGFFCAGYSTYWEQGKLYFYDLSTSPTSTDNETVFANKKAIFVGASRVDLEGNDSTALSNKMSPILNDHKLPMQEKIRRLFKETLPTNHFFENSNDNLLLDRRFVTAVDEQVEYLFTSLDVFTKSIDNQVVTQRGETPLMDILKMMLAKFRYKIVCNPQPILIKDKPESKKETRNFKEDTLNAIDQALRKSFNLDSTIENVEKSVKGVMKSTQQLANGKTRVNTFVNGTEFTGSRAWEFMGFDKRSSDAKLKEIADKFYVTIEDDVLNNPSRISEDERETARIMGFANDQTRDVLVDLANKERAKNALQLLKTFRDELFNVDSDSFKSQTSMLQLSSGDDAKNEIAQYMLLPKTDFAAIPACNVLFPNHQETFGMQRDYLAEPTRMLATVVDQPNASARYFIAPSSINQAVIPVRKRLPPNVGAGLVSSDGYALPVVPFTIRSGFGKRVHPVTKKISDHKGLDLVGRRGQEVYAYAAGVVRTATFVGGKTGNQLTILHSNGLKTNYFHLDGFNVKAQDKVVAGQLVAFVGNTGVGTGPHLHFEIFKNKVVQDPTQKLIDIETDIASRPDATRNSPKATSEEPVEEGGETIEEAAKKNENLNRFEDFKYLTKEEEITGIIPTYRHTVDRVLSIFDHGSKARTESTRDRYLSQIIDTMFLEDKYSQRRISPVPGPFNPSPVAGFPGLIIDQGRSVIGSIVRVEHTIRVGGGVGNADTTVSIEKPRFWDEGDPYFWKDGIGGEFIEKKLTEVDRTVKLPNSEKSSFPSHVNAKYIDTKSYDNVDPSLDKKFGGNEWGSRDVDKLYKSMLGVNAIPYSQETYTNPHIGLDVFYNGAIDFVDPEGGRPGHTLLGRYYELADAHEELAENFANDFTRRLGISERELFVEFFGGTFRAGAYASNAFRESYQKVSQVLAIKLGQTTHRG
jgi:murein DD-endopeptidase MepM/ murein hydrolase activator NlpD